MMVVSGSTNSNTSWGEKAQGEKEEVEGWCWGSAPANRIIYKIIYKVIYNKIYNNNI